MSHQLTVMVHPETYAICRLKADADVPEWACRTGWHSITRTGGELSIVCEAKRVPAGVRAERNRRLLQIEGKLPLAMTGVLASIASPLAEAKISIFAVSTYDTDYLLIAGEELEEACKVLERAGHGVLRSA